MANPRLRLEDFSDRELLLAYQKAAAGGGASAHDVAAELGITVANPDQSVAVRFGWLRKYGVMEKDKDGLWVPTTTGERLLDGEMRAAQKRAMEEMDETQLYAATIALTRRLASTNNDAAARMMNRQMRYGVAQSRSRFR